MDQLGTAARRWEFVGGGSEKFWELERAGATVIVRFGRIGTNGQVKAKELASVEAARSHAEKLIAEKERKGYREAGEPTAPEPGPQPQPAPVSTDEDTVVVQSHVLANPALEEKVLPPLEPAAAVALSTAAEVTPQVEDASEDCLPRVLVSPPWTVKREQAEPIVITGLQSPAERHVVWIDDERQQWENSSQYQQNGGWAFSARDFHEGDVPLWVAIRLFASAPEEIARPLLKDWRPTEHEGGKYFAARMIARFELDALPLVLVLARARPTHWASFLAPYFDSEIAVCMAEWLVRLKSLRTTATAWFDRHSESAVRALVPAALGTDATQRRAAETALQLIAKRAGNSVVLDVAREYGPEATEAVAAQLAVDPLDVLPAKMPKLAAWAHAGVLPQLLLRDRRSALPTAAANSAIMMLAISRPGDVYPGVAVLKEICDPASLAEFGWTLFEHWRTDGTPAKDAWALTVLGAIGDDDTVRRLKPLILAWPGESGHHRAVAGLDVLAEIGTDVALTQLNAVAQRAKFKGLKTRAQEKIAEVADQLGLSAEQLADRLVPDFGLDADGSMTLDYGPRGFVVGFDEQLKPFVADADGKRRKDLPKPGAKDDQELAPLAHKRFATLKKDVRTTAADQIRRLEAAMVRGRRWTLAEFQELFVAHPLLWHIARRLVWASYDGDQLGTAFRLAEDRTFADVGDDALELADTVEIGLAHPLHLGDALQAWAEVFADYEILQPFPQLGRAVHAFTAEELTANALKRFHGIAVPTGRIVGLQRRGWERAMPQDNGIEPWISRAVPGGAVVINLDPGITVGMLEMFPEQRIEDIWVNDTADGAWDNRRVRGFAELDPVTASEVLAELTELTTT
ncbi:WGR and DUF4132 domain-containing protein [Allokutzneria sp. NRRL B-24872]|uniref:WGR and DUF4132 domain-containing protein n=1 Tax=Allokutzneria sp. NRRL B-24872 TaxID=1137961 RepID=UPI000A3D406F|nr:DUF4132 domain-containing protein [Allokutzneria sp. NRRL B-24872]